VRLSYAALWGTFTAAFVAVILVALAMSHVGAGWDFAVSRSDLVWGLATAAGVFSRLAISLWFKSAHMSDEEAVRAARLSVWNGVYAGAAWGSASWLLLPAHGLAQEGFLLVVMSMVMIGGVGGQAVHRAVVIAFSVSLTVVFSTGLVRFGDSPHVLLALGYFPFCAVLVMYARNQEAAVTAAIELSLQNNELLALRTQQEHAARQAQADAEAAREHAERADRAKTTFIAAASHDLRQPMHALVQYVGHMQRICTDPAAHATLEKIEESVSAMEDLLNAVLDFSKISLGSVKPRIELVDIECLLSSVDTQIRPLAEAKGLVLAVESDGGFVLSDAVLLERVVRNIAQNAVRYTESGSVTIRATQRGHIIRILVSDSGIGIPASEKQRIFEEYYQVNNQARDRRKGLGLGLAIVRELAELLAIRIRLKTVAGHGSTFVIDVRRADGPPVAAASVSEPPSIDYVKGAFVVLIDDDPMARDGVATTLKDFGCRVLAVASGVDALHALVDAEFPPQVIVADYRLEGGQTGLDAIAMVVENQVALCGESFRLPALLISGDTSPQELKRVFDAGYHMLHKPVSIELLHRELNSVLESMTLASAQTHEL
jgi:two-component system, sensor histidine kinase